MQSLKAFLGALFSVGSRLSDLEKRILDAVRARLDSRIVALWDKQVLSINKIQRLPEGVEVNFYRMKNGRPSFDPELAFPNKAEELQLARVEIRLADTRYKLIATIWCVQGFLFSIEYEGSVSYFEEAAGMDSSTLQVNCQLIADLMTST